MWRSFIPPPLHVPGRRRDSRPCDGSAQCQGCQCTALSPQLLVALKSARRLAISAALFRQALLVLRGHPGVAPWLSHEGLTKFEGGLGHELVPPGAVLRQGSPIRECRREVEVGQVALKRPAVGHFLAASDSRLRDPREHEALGKAVLVHPGHVPCPEQCATREVVLEREDPGALLLMVTRHISRIRLLCQLASRRTDSAVRLHDSQPYSRTARTPPA